MADNIKSILDEIKNESSTKQKGVILSKYKDNELLKKVLYNSLSGRVNFYIKQIPNYISTECDTLETALDNLEALSSRKVTGQEASNWLCNILSRLSPDDAYIIERIIDRDPKIGMNRKSVDKVIPNLIEITPYQGAKPYSLKGAQDLFAKSKGKGVYADVKADGCYNNGKTKDGEVVNESRQGEIVDFGPLSGFTQELKLFPDGVLNGELTIPGYIRTVANGIINSLSDYVINKNERTDKENQKKVEEFIKKHNVTMEEIIPQITYTVWDRIETEVYENAKIGSKIPYEQRWEELKRIHVEINPQFIKLIEKKEVFTFEEAMQYFQDKKELGEEGIILKSKDGLWVNGKPSYQIKLKLEIEVEMRIVGANYGGKNTKNKDVYSTFKTISEDGLVTANPGGMSEIVMADITANLDKYLNTIVTVKANGLTSNRNGGRSLMHPRVGAFRHDKDIANTLEEIKDIELMSMGLK